MRINRYGIGLLFAAVLTAAGVLAPQVSVTPAAAPIIKGDKATEGPWAAFIEIPGLGSCTGSLIAENWVLTARHCAYDNVTLHIGDLDHNKGAVRKAAQIIRHPSADLALFRLDQPVKSTYAKLASVAPKVGDLEQPYGWGADDLGQVPQYLKTATMKITAVGAEYIDAVKVTGWTAGGDSGGPVFAGGVQIGVHSYGNIGAGTSGHTNVATYKSWIDSTTSVSSAPAARIGNGELASQAEAPWAVAMLLDGRLNCTGSLIAERWVLTAKHCDHPGYEFRIGNVDYAKGAVRKPVKTVLHPDTDLVLYQLDQPVRTTFAKLTSVPPKPGDLEKPYGFGRTESSGTEGSQFLKKATMKIRIVDANLITADKVDGSYTMSGDSGGPVFVGGVQVGVHYGSNQASGIAGHTNVATYRQWIDSTIAAQ
ncbi:hypothetical protein D5S17_16865 [Pseudonocardiaceae bacterium YIM PH 21723]|nr:hypothetical protein D5S17_16865 [Pseudonocardiaceae bacterium YIM PH 21723]